jgi:tetraacyldisaccharide 4'-kinase
LRSPDFWSAPDHPTATLLAPLGYIYAAAGRLRQMTTVPKRVGIPVICVGNLVTGGAGKTPVALALGGRLVTLGFGPVHFLTRGYGGSEHGPLRVNALRHGFRHVGDEALLLAAAAPTWVAHDRVAGARAAQEAGAACIVMDDGFQNPSLHKDLSLLVIDAVFGFGNGRVLPAGPLREPVSDGLARADAVVLIGEDRPGLGARLGDRSVLRGTLTPTVESRANLSGRRVLAFAGIGRPEKFFDTLRALGCDIAEARSFADHHPYSRHEVDDLLATAARLNAVPVTTAKDAVRLPNDMRPAILTLDITLVWDDETALDRWLVEKLTMPRT